MNPTRARTAGTRPQANPPDAAPALATQPAQPAARLAQGEGTAALEKALDVLDAVGNAAGAALTQAELAQRLGLPRTTLYRLLGTLVDRGLLRRDPVRRQYGLGPRCFEYARAAYALPDLVAASNLELRALRDMTGETSYLAGLDGPHTVVLDRCDGAHSQRSNAALGNLNPLHCTSQGKAMLSAMPSAQRDAVVRDLHLTAATPRSITDRRRLQAELRLTAQRGYAIDDEEIVLGVRCCGAPIVDRAGQVRGAISVAGPAYRLTMERLQLLGPEVAEAARRVGAQLAAAQPAHALGEARAVLGDWAFDGAYPHSAAGAVVWVDRLAPALHRVMGDVPAPAAVDTVVARMEAPVDAVVPVTEDALRAWNSVWGPRAQTARVALRAGAPLLAVLSAGRWALMSADGADLGPVPWPARALVACAGGAGHPPWAALCIEGATSTVGPLGAEGEVHPQWQLHEPVHHMAASADGRCLYLAAAGSGTLYAAQVGQRNLRRLATVPKGSGRLAGLALDPQGGLWTALRGGWSVARFEADGSMDRMVPLPVPDPTGVCVTLRDTGEPVLWVTSAREALDRESLDAAPLSGRLFAVALPKA